MDIATLIGLLGAIGIVLAAIVTGGSLALFINVPSILIVFGGTGFVVMTKFSVKQIPIAFKAAMKAFLFKIDKPVELIDKAFELSTAVRKNGVLALESIPVENEFLSKGVNMLVDGIDIEIVRGILAKERSLVQQRHDQAIKIFRATSDVAPAMGMIGTLVGLVQMLANMSDPDAIGPAMATALLTTLYGAFIANVVSTPIADKLELRSEEEDNNQALIIDVIQSIGAGIHPNIMKDSLQNYLPKSERKFEDEAA
tara:strand:- start:6090 stop:6854 length:765 start_codon:yes stop_codon:yes gene_type:complete